jgi:hypothetical protein
LKASAHACKAGLNVLTLASNIAGTSNIFSALAKTFSSSSGLSSIYEASDVLSFNTERLNAGQRDRDTNTYMIFVQMAVIGNIQRKYGNPSAEGAQGTNLIYVANGVVDAGEMSNTDACALASALVIIQDSFSNSNLTDSDTAIMKSSVDAICGAGGVTCTDITKDRSSCTGAAANPPSVAAAAIVTQVNTAW